MLTLFNVGSKRGNWAKYMFDDAIWLGQYTDIPLDIEDHIRAKSFGWVLRKFLYKAPQGVFNLYEDRGIEGMNNTYYGRTHFLPP